MCPTSRSSDLTVIIPVLGDYETLKACLRDLESQTVANSSFEVLVVDNGTPTEEFEDPTTFSSELTVRLIREPRGGSYAARNAGIQHSETDFLAFTDADCRPDNEWIESGLRALEPESVGLVAGKVEVVQETEGSPNFVELQRLRSAFPQEQYIREKGFGATANVFTKRSVFREVGLFRAELKSSGDEEWGRRVKQAGFELCYAGNAVVKHRARSSISELLEKSIRTAVGSYQVARIEEKSSRFDSESDSVVERFREIVADVVNGTTKLMRDPTLDLHQKVGVACVSGLQQITFRATQRMLWLRDALSIEE
jgi:glycosyltransferase involved in cell wall biosynthesis